MMLSEICGEIRNYFCSGADKHMGHFAITGNTISLNFLKNGQYFRIIGSVFNDGVYQYPPSGLTDEEFDGAVWAMKVPPSFIALCGEIESYLQSDDAKPSPFVSESFGGYSYSKSTNGKGTAASWQTLFASKLDKWRRLHI